MEPYKDRRHFMQLDDETIDIIVERVTNKILDPLVDKVSARIEDKFFQNAGKKFIGGSLYLVGVIGVGLLYFLNSHNLLKF